MTRHSSQLNFLRRGYLDLLLPLEYGQICPILFLWAELTAVKLFGFSEMSLRLCPLICGVASVFLFRHTAGRMLKGPALLMAVAIFAVSIHPIRHSADAKPYASDLLVALGTGGAGDRVVRVVRADRLALDAGRLRAARVGGFVSGGVGRGGNRTGTGAVSLEDATAGAENRPRGLRFGCGDDVRGPVRRLCAPPADGAVVASAPELLGRFFPPARLARAAGELADHDSRRQHVRLPVGGGRGASSGTLFSCSSPRSSSGDGASGRSSASC